jgi:trehalose 6-phosphate phosphatase
MPQLLFDVLDEIAQRVRDASRLLLCLDFDGTLVPFAPDPAKVVLPPPMARILRALVEHESLNLAVISGRERNDLHRRVGIPGVIYAGNHGLDIGGPGFVFVEPTAASRTEDLRELAKALTTNLHPIAGVIVEDKGLTISIHYRQVAEDALDELRRIVHSTLAATSHPFVLGAGAKVHEIRPRVYWNKGTAVCWIRDQLGEPRALPIYVGDDTTDEDAFNAIKDDGITVKVGVTTETAAHYRIEGPADVQRFLEWLNRTLLPASTLGIRH